MRRKSAADLVVDWNPKRFLVLLTLQENCTI